MASPQHTGSQSAASTPGASAVTPAGSHAVVVHSDLRCPWAHIAVHRLLAAADRLGAGNDLCIDHRWFPLDGDAVPDSLDELDRMLEPLTRLEPDAGWTTWAGSEHAFPADSRGAAAWVQAAKAVSPAASMALDRALRVALFADGRPLDDDTVRDIADHVDGIDADDLAAEVGSGRPDAELDQHAALAGSDLVPASPTIILADGTTWTNPGIEFHVDGGVPVIDRDDAGAHDEIVEAFLALRHFD